MNASHQRRLTPLLGGMAVVLGVLLLLLLGGMGRSVRWKTARALPPLPPP
jgi:general secretion pathway protein N